MRYVSAGEAKRILHINPTTLKTWKDTGIIKYKKLTSKKFLYDIDSVENKENDQTRYNAIYARVSNTKQFEDLNQQIELVKNFCTSRGIVIDNIYKDIASGMNEDRKGFNNLIDDVIDGKINKVYVTFKDRLTRFGFDYFRRLFEKFGTEIVIIDTNEESNQTFQNELCNDLISIIHRFSMKLYSNRRKKFKEIEKILEDK